MEGPAEQMGGFRRGLRRLFYGHRPPAVAFQAGLLVLDLAAIGYFLVAIADYRITRRLNFAGEADPN